MKNSRVAVNGKSDYEIKVIIAFASKILNQTSWFKRFILVEKRFRQKHAAWQSGLVANIALFNPTTLAQHSTGGIRPLRPDREILKAVSELTRSQFVHI